MKQGNPHPNVQSFVDGIVEIQIQHFWRSVHRRSNFFQLNFNKHQCSRMMGAQFSSTMGRSYGKFKDYRQISAFGLK